VLDRAVAVAGSKELLWLSVLEVNIGAVGDRCVVRVLLSEEITDEVAGGNCCRCRKQC
jgi:hypothetical protein